MPPPCGNVSLWFRLVVVAAGAFIITILAMIVSTLFGNADAPMTQFFNRQGGRLIAAEATITLLFALFALIGDRRQILRDLDADKKTSHSNVSTIPNRDKAIPKPTVDADG